MLRQFLVGGTVSACTVTIHALIMATVMRVAQAAGARDVGKPWLYLVVVMIATLFVLMAAHVGEVFVWAFSYWLLEVTTDGTNDVYFAFVNFATLGYGDVTPVRRWLLLGPITAMNGALLFGWSTAVIFAVLQRAMMRAGQAALID